MIYLHSGVLIVSFISLLFGSFLPASLQWVSLIFMIVSAILIAFELYKMEKEIKRKEVEELRNIDIKELPYIEGTFLFEASGFTPTLREFSLITLETEESTVGGYCNNQYLINLIKNANKPVRVYYYKNYILDVKIV